MAIRNWGLITSGATFEALATTLIFFEDPRAALFGRPGKDGGQDARSGDGTTVFQAKYHEAASAGRAIAAAKKEAAKIGSYLAADHPRREQWRAVIQWRLVTNATFNPTDRQVWDEQVSPLFAAHGLQADYWERANVDGLLDKHPEVDRAFFQNEIRAFLTLPEVRDLVRAEEPFLERPGPTGFFGRKTEANSVRSFLTSDALFLVVHGAGGVGKTRLLLEASQTVADEGEWQVLWANKASMLSNASWFRAIVPERPTVLLVDEPETADLLRLLTEQLSGGASRAGRWKVAVAVRSPKDPVLRFLSGPRMQRRVKNLPLDALAKSAAEDMCRDLLGSGPLAQKAESWRSDVARKLSVRFSQYPLWLTLAIHLLERHGDLTRVPETADALAESYLSEIIEFQNESPPQHVLQMLRWVALIGTVNLEDDTIFRLLVEESQVGNSTAARALLTNLLNRKALVQRGARGRLVEVKPDLLRDHILQTWLCENPFDAPPTRPSPDAILLAEEMAVALTKGRADRVTRAVLDSLTRTELLLRLSERSMPLLDPFFGYIAAEAETLSVARRLEIIEALPAIASCRPADTLALCRRFRDLPASPETVDGIFGPREIGQDDLLLALAWPLFHAAMGAQSSSEETALLEELCALVEVEHTIVKRRSRELWHDGKRAQNLLVRTLEGGPQFLGDFGKVAEVYAVRLLNEAAREQPTPARTALLQALLSPLLAVHRSQSWSEESTVYFQTYLVLPGDPRWTRRDALLGRIKELLSDSSAPLATKLVLWGLVVNAHQSANRGVGPTDRPEPLHRSLVDDLTWALSLLGRPEVNLEELAAARPLWEWHYKFDNEADLKTAAETLEQLYMRNAIANEFEPLLGIPNDVVEQDTRIAQKAADLAASDGSAEIAAFLDRAIRFLGSQDGLYRVMHIAGELGALASKSAAAREFVIATLAEDVLTYRSDFAATMAASWVRGVRTNEGAPAALAVVQDLVSAAQAEDLRIHLLMRVYSRGQIGAVEPAEYELLRSMAPLFIRKGRAHDFLAVAGWTFRYDWQSFKAVVSDTLAAIPPEERALALNSLIETLYWAIHRGDRSFTPHDLGSWLLDQLTLLPRIDELGGNAEHLLREIFTLIDRVPLPWLSEALRMRRDMEVNDGHRTVRAASHGARLSQYTQPVTGQNVGDAALVGAVESLADLAVDDATVGYHLPSIVRDIDPEGLLVPAAVARRVPSADDAGLWRLARLASAYPIGSAAWRVIAKAVMARGRGTTGSDERSELFNLLSDRGMRSWSGTLGEVPAIFVTAVQQARERLESESDRQLLPLWEWQLKIAEAELREQEERAKEERGE
jgi:hypothetical protein